MLAWFCGPSHSIQARPLGLELSNEESMFGRPNPPEGQNVRNEETDPGSIPPPPPSPGGWRGWIWIALPGLYFASFFAMIVLDHLRLVSPSLYPLIRVVYFPLIRLMQAFPIVDEGVRTFVGPLVRLFR